ncbi:unnamed protein product, partial [Scytosiphon promiscuus]
MFKHFCTAVSDAIFKIIPGSREQVRGHLRNIGLSDTQIKRVRRKYWRTRARFRMPGPETLQRDLMDVYDFFRPIVDPTTGRKFFNSDHAKRFRTGMADKATFRHPWGSDVHQGRGVQEWASDFHLCADLLPDGRTSPPS